MEMNRRETIELLKSMNQAKLLQAGMNVNEQEQINIEEFPDDTILSVSCSICGTFDIPSECLQNEGKYIYKIKYSDVDKKIL